MNFGFGTFLTPQNRPGNSLSHRDAIVRTHINGGLIYTSDKVVVPQSIDNRFAVVPMDETLPTIDMSDKIILFLGYYFRHYGHFILETLPMLSYCLDEQYSNMSKMFLPYFLNANNIKNNIDKAYNSNLIIAYLSLLGINQDNILLHTKNAVIKSNFLVPGKIVNGNRDRIAIDPYIKVINKIKHSFEYNNQPYKKIFIVRKPDTHRITATVANNIVDFVASRGLEIINMENLNIEQQLLLMHDTKLLVGFSGSGMHNSMFMRPGSVVININDLRDFKSPKCYVPNQRLCNRISECEEHFISFECQSNMKKSDFIPPNDKLNSTQEEYASKHIIHSLSSLFDSI